MTLFRHYIIFHGTGVAQSVQYLTTDCPAGVRSPTEAEDFYCNFCVQTGSGAHPASCTVRTAGSFPGENLGRGVMLTTHPLLVPRVGAISPLTQMSLYGA
jgi:hypothetical protein